MNTIRNISLWNISPRNHVINYRKYLETTQQYLHSSSSSSSSSNSSSSSSSSDSDDPKKSDPKEKNEDKLKKLNSLLLNLVQQDRVTTTSSTLNLAQPTKKRGAKPKDHESKPENKAEKLSKAVKDVAQVVGGDVKQTESELLMKLLSPAEPSQENATKNLSDIVKGMKIDRETKTVEQTRADEVRNILSRFQSQPKRDTKTEGQARRPPRSIPKREIVMTPIDLFGSESLGLFSNKSELKEVPGNNTWDALYSRDLRLAITHPPANYFQQMILWTDQGKLWKFPIDNEQDLEEEKKIYFAEHVFLEEHLEPWCPPKGPIRHFMELVCVGLSKNHHFTVEKKKEHIEWFRNYFEDKKTLLQEVGALSLDKPK